MMGKILGLSDPHLQKENLNTYSIRLPMQEMQVQYLVREDSPGKGNGIHCSILAWEIPWTEEAGRLQSMGSQRVIHGLTTEQYIYLPLLLSLPSLSRSSYSDPSNLHSKTLNLQPLLVHPIMSFFF